jgi:hypothetical protein
MSANRGFAKTKIFDFWHIAKIVQNTNFGNLHKEYDEGKPIEEIAKIMQNTNFGNLHKEYEDGKPIEEIAKIMQNSNFTNLHKVGQILENERNSIAKEKFSLDSLQLWIYIWHVGRRMK